MQLNTKYGVKGQFAVQVLDANGNVKETRPLADNLVLDNMFRHLCGSSQIPHNDGYKAPASMSDSFQLILGTGSGQITAQDTALLSNKTYSYVNYQSYKYSYPVEPNKLKTILTLDYAWVNTTKSGVILTELGLGFANNTRYMLLTHAKFKGVNDDELSLTVLPYETLKVVYILTMSTNATPVRKRMSVTYKDGENTTTKEYNTVLSVYGCPRAFSHSHIVGRQSSYATSIGFGTLEASQTIDKYVVTDTNRANFRFESSSGGHFGRTTYAYYDTLEAQAAALAGSDTYKEYAAYKRLETGEFSMKTQITIGTVQDFNLKRGLCGVYFSTDSNLNLTTHSLVLAIVDDKGKGIMKDTTQRIHFTLTTEFTRSE